MTPERAEARRKYCRERYLARRGPLKPKEYSSQYRYKNDGFGSGVTAHKLIVEKVLGRPLPEGAEIHHVDGNGLNNAHKNLVVCPDRAYHALLHRRTEAFEKCGHADWYKCVLCKEWDAPENLSLYVPKDQKTPRGMHLRCNKEYKRRKYGKRRYA